MKITEFGQFEVHAFQGQARRIITTKWLPLSIAIIYMDYDIDSLDKIRSIDLLSADRSYITTDFYNHYLLECI